ncbi:Leucine-rich repeat receptor-like serine/threonine-protein kinase BAM1 [Carex littledalei]|uniref:Leucine-rich repeat receptor-like serine/threonine-protein kinase BAM1 n=1 Tax=Carex littledalei TaxID=544730 RepID=A0A833QUF7_9POAL|nr:Leucine-rich repeat receptor-like serine/threonine-protein kinase BAM1 [Carex littledalei]
MTLVALVSISFVLFYFSINTTTLTQAHCLPEQHHSLIQLKQCFNTTKLNSWNVSTDCCIWDGIKCDEQTGMVTALNLAHMFISGELNPAYLNLRLLHYLNLSRNLIDNVILPQTGFERLGLRTLLSNVTKLQFLRLDGVDISLNGSEWGKAVLQVGPTLRELLMVDCGLIGNFPDEIFHFTNITYLDLSYNSMLLGQLSEFTKLSLL